MRKEEMENYYTIDINGEAMPLACTLRVLEEITKKYGSIEEFCLKVYKPKMDDESKKIVTMAMPDIDAIYSILPIMVEEGIYLLNENKRNKIEAVSADYIYRHYETPLHDIGFLMFSEVMRSIKAPKRQPLTVTTSK